MGQSALEERLAQVRKRILARSRQTLTEAATLLVGAEKGEVSLADRERAYTLIHNLAGVTGSVGLPEIGKAAKALDEMLRPWLRDNQSTPPWRPAFSALTSAFEAAQTPES